MNEKKNLELLIESFGLDPFGVENYIPESNGNAGSGSFWRGKGIDENNDVAISFCDQEGYNSAVSEINAQALANGYKRS